MTHILLMAVAALASAVAIPLTMVAMAKFGLTEPLVISHSGKTHRFGSWFARTRITIPTGASYSFAGPRLAAAAIVLTITVIGNAGAQIDSRATLSTTMFSS